MCYLVEYGSIQVFEERDTATETLFEINLTTHSTECDGLYFFTYSGSFCQFVDTFRFGERRIHIKTDETAVATIHIVFLERNIDTFFGRYFHKAGGELVFVAQLTPNGEFNARAKGIEVGSVQGRTSGETLDRIDIEIAVGKGLGNQRNLLGSDFFA